MQESASVLARAELIKHSIFRTIAETRDRMEPGKDTRIFR